MNVFGIKIFFFFKMFIRYDILGKVNGIGWCLWCYNGMEICIVML